MEGLAHCLVCEVEAPHPKDFLCERCAQPGKILVRCASCGNRYEVIAQSPSAKGLAQDLNLPITPGTAMKISGCPKCTPSRTIRVEVFRIYTAN